MQELQRLLDHVALAIEKVAGALMALITVLVVASAISRYIFAYPLPDAFDVSRYLLGAAIMWGFASVGFRGSHIKVDLLAEILPRGVRRWTDTFAWAVLLLFTVLLTWKMFGRVTSAAGSGESTMDLRLPAWPFITLIWVGVAVSVLAIVARLIIVASGRGGLDHYDAIDDGDV